jgi:hypothetical protein
MHVVHACISPCSSTILVEAFHTSPSPCCHTAFTSIRHTPRKRQQPTFARNAYIYRVRRKEKEEQEEQEEKETF